MRWAGGGYAGGGARASCTWGGACAALHPVRALACCDSHLAHLALSRASLAAASARRASASALLRRLPGPS
eukprot:1139119-Alexandrium_andersonii.AAC.1